MNPSGFYVDPAFGLYYFWETYINNFIVPKKVQFVLTRSPQE